MGIDVYLKWDGQTEKEKQAQFTGFNIASGHVGYLREAYSSSPFATYFLFPENNRKFKPFVVPNAMLVERLPAALKAIKERYADDKKAMTWATKSFKDFVALHGKLEKAGKHPKIAISG
jgi:hypothetical protein